MMEDNEIAVSHLEAGEEVREDVQSTERVEKCANEGAPNLSAGAFLKRIHERRVQVEQVKR